MIQDDLAIGQGKLPEGWRLMTKMELVRFLATPWDLGTYPFPPTITGLQLVRRDVPGILIKTSEGVVDIQTPNFEIIRQDSNISAAIKIGFDWWKAGGVVNNAL